ncbi:MAG: HAD family hydrolase [Fusobacterium sp. JB021]|nr:HAD family hydrolase [Fusobacterium sp. JB020]MDP0494128.1 HAD family hydrolase [Fusobacterium sp. JB021]MDP0506240.1 HAD family hydrolase [Fusobacterium sp. JB019]
MKENKIKAILFDMDGTLMNTLDDLTDSTNYILEKNNLPKRTKEEVRNFVGHGIKWTIIRAVPKGTSEEVIEKCYREMLVYYKKHSMIKTAPYKGVKKLMERLHKEGYRIAIITNKAEASAKIITEKFFGDIVDFTIGDNEKTPLKPSPDNVYRALENLGINKEEAVYIGDSEVDVLTGKNSSMEMIAVLWGFRDKDILLENGAKIFAEDVLALEKEIKKLG